MFLSLPLLNICSNGRVFCILDALVEKMINHVVLIWTVKFNVKQVKEKSLEVCATSKVIWFLEFYIFPGYKNINMLKTVLKKNFMDLFLWMEFNCLKARATSRRQFTFYH